MKFEAVSTVFAPAALKEMESAYDQSCLWLTGSDGKGPDELTRMAVAVRLIKCAGSGERNSLRLRAYAVARLYSGVHHYAN
jgi:hypothetical protein